MGTIIGVITTAVNIAFFQGLLLLLGIPPLIPKAAILVSFGCALVLTLTYYKIKNSKFMAFFVFSLLLFSFTVFVSHCLNGAVVKETISFYHYTFTACVAFFIFSNLPLNDALVAVVLKNFEFLFIFQIIFIFFKFMIVGITESHIGTISYQGGAIATIFPLLAISYYMNKFFFVKKRLIYLFFCLSFLFMAFATGKRAIYFFLPIILFLFVIVKCSLETREVRQYLKIIAVSTIISTVVFYLGVKGTPSLNPEHSRWGSFNISHVVDYVKQYNYSPQNKYVDGRMAGLLQAFRYISEQNFAILFFGAGPDQLINYKSRDGTEQKFGIGSSGSITGMATYLISVGVLGSVAVILPYVLIGIKSYFTLLENNSQIRTSKIVYLKVFVVCAMFVFLIDYIFYTRSFIHNHALNLVYFILAGISVNRTVNNRTENKFF
ncbi:MAG: hypothetical protein V6Z89_05695 [Desulfobacter sp.]